jgi:ABC-type multidrug transport system fused ATPase/permease subunit
VLACAVSIIIIFIQAFTLKLSRKHRGKRDALLVNVTDQEELVDDEGESDSESDLTLQKSLSRSNLSIRNIDRPRGEVLLVTVELIALLGQLAVSLVAIFSDHGTSDGSSKRIAIARLVVWIYIAAMVSLRLFLSASHWQLSFLKLWNHTAFLYSAQWLFEIFVFRSVIIHPRGTTGRVPTIEFGLTTLLFSIILISRKGNRDVVLEYEGDIEPSHEPRASLLSLASFSWADTIIWRGWNKTLEMSDVWNVQLKDKAEIVLSSFRQVKKTHSLAVRLLLYFKRKLLIQAAWSMLGSILMFLPTLLLKAILEYLEDTSSTPPNAAWLYVILLFVTSAVQAVADGQGLWIGRRICIQIRAIIIGEIYSKTLRRKATASVDTDLGESKREEMPKKLSQNILSFGSSNQAKVKNGSTKLNAKSSDAQVSNGTIINLMSVDSFKVSEICSYLHFFWAATPVQLAMAIGLLYRVLGSASFAGVGLMVFILPLNLFIANSFQATQKKIMAATDKRIHSTNEVLENIRIIKYFAWEQRFSTEVSDKRRTELKALRLKYILWSCAFTVWSGIPLLITFVSFFIYTVVQKKPLVPSIAFPALSMFSLLRIPLDQLADMIAHIQEAKVSVDRVEEFLEEEETEKYLQLRQSKLNCIDEPRIALRSATLTWGIQSPRSTTDNSVAFRLINIDVEFIPGQLNIIAGATGSGKTSLLMALLGEMKLLEGCLQLPGGFVRQKLRPDPQTGLTESIAYCAQQAWLVNDTIKENILFASPYDEERYKAVLSACALERDLAILVAGDQTLVGEKGITLSGGQKQRISLARAMYCNSKHLLLDDCLSAVDSHTARHIFEEAIMGSLMSHRTCILVTHNVSLTVPKASFVVVLENGKVIAQGDPELVAASGALGDDLLKSRSPSTGTPYALSRVPSNLDEETSKLPGGQRRPNRNANGSDDETAKSDNKLVDTRMETKAEGSVKAATIKMYVKSMGPWYFWIFAATAFIATQLGSVATNVWIRQWANSYHTARIDNQHAVINALHPPASIQMTSSFGSSLVVAPQTSYSSLFSPLSTESYQVEAGYYLGIYAILALVYISICFSREMLMFWGSLRASQQIHNNLLNSVLHAKFKFFDSTPLGQMMNRFSKDIQSIDQEVAAVAVGLFHSVFAVITIVILITVITPGFLIPGIFICGIYTATGLFYVRSSRDLKRIEAVQRSPLFQHFGETLSGVVTIRAYGDESRFITDSHKRVNTHNRPFLYLWATNRWLAFRIDTAGALVSFSSALFIVLNVGHIDSGTAGLALTYAITFTQNVLWLVRLYAANEQNMNAVERVQEYIEVEQEAKAHIPETKPAANWPSHGAVEFIGYSTRYRSDLDPVLNRLTFKINGGEKVGIVGRTGAGKSSLALALFRGLEADEGKILIDDVDIGLIGLQDLREAITIVPQDPTLFTGTIRNNLDPFGLFTDEEIFTALQRVHLISSAKPASESSGTSTPTASSADPTLTGALMPRHQNGGIDLSNSTVSSDATLVKYVSNSRENKNLFRNLSSPVAESGSNLSQGQRQLLCLARALLKSPKVLIMDEATASIDYAIDAKIQDTLRELKDNTVITIAHRLQTIIDYDKVLVLDRGQLVEYAAPWELLQKGNGVFKSMCETSGELDTLLELAKKAWMDRRLVDDL